MVFIFNPITTLKNPYGLDKDEELITADKAIRGLSCNCICPACRKKLQANKGEEKRAYFSHYRGSDCGFGLQTATHIMAKEIIKKEKRIILPSHVVQANSKKLGYIKKERNFDYFDLPKNLWEKEIVKPWQQIELDSVELEKKIGNIIPDIVVRAKEIILYLEIKVTHGIDEDKIKYIQEENLNVIEYDFSEMADIIDSDHLRNVLTKTHKGAKKGYGWSHWVNHVDTIKHVNELTLNLKNLYPAKPPWELKKKS